MRKGVHLCTIVMAVISAVCVVVIAGSITVDVILRETRGSGIKGVVEYTEILLTALVFLALADGERTRNHIKLVLVTGLVPRRVAQVMRALGGIVSLVLVSAIAYYSFDRLLTSIETQEFRYGLLRVPTWPARLAIFIGFLVLAFECLLTVVDHVKALRHGTDIEPELSEEAPPF